ncbi:MAG: Flp pilus assembly protein CpaB [Phycisphaerales bacterium]|nr:MAG: Flp pilus assembly protein CpaB [Phycisphaerales bacterium]
MKRKAIIPLLLGLGVGLFTVKLAVDAIRKAQAAGQSTQTVKAVRATQDINAYEKITTTMVEVVETADSLFAPTRERIETVEEVVGRVAGKAIPERAPVLRAMLAPEGTMPGMVGRIPPGYRAVSVKIDEVTGVAYQIKPGDWVDVIVVMDIDSQARGRKETIAEVILQHVQVAAIGHATTQQPSSGGTKVKPAKSATLLVLEEDVPKLHLAATRGKVTLAMRGADPKTSDSLPSANMGDVIAALRDPTPSSDSVSPWMQAMGKLLADQAAQSKPRRTEEPVESEPEPPHTVMVYRGSPGADASDAVERITFENGDSSNIIEVSQGHPSRASATLGVSRDSGRSWPTKRGSANRSRDVKDETKPNDG